MKPYAFITCHISLIVVNGYISFCDSSPVFIPEFMHIHIDTFTGDTLHTQFFTYLPMHVFGKTRIKMYDKGDFNWLL